MKNNATVIYEQIATVSSSGISRLVVGGNVFISDRLGVEVVYKNVAIWKALGCRV